MTEREYLQRPERLEAQIQSKLNRIAHLRSMAEKCTAILSGLPRGAMGKDYTDYLSEAMALEDEIRADLDVMRAYQGEIRETIGRVNDDRYRQLLELRYLCRMKWEAIAEEMTYDVRWVYVLHKRALKALETTQHGASGDEPVQ